MKTTGEPRAGVTLPWTLLTTSSLVVAVGSLGALAIVATIKDADALSVVALALAILAFVIQIIVFIAQMSAASQQVEQNLAVNSETKSLLSELQTQARDTNAVINEQYNKLLDRLLLVTKEAGDEPAEDPQEGVAEIRRALSEEIRALQNSLRHSSRPMDEDSGLRFRSGHEAHTWPSLRVVRALQSGGLADLDHVGLAELKRFAADWENSLNTGLPEGLGADPADPGVAQLLERRFIRFFSAVSAGDDEIRPVFRLSAMGRAAAPLFTTPGPIPAALGDALPWLAEAR